MEKLCHVCYNKLQWAALPEEQRRHEWLNVVPQRFIEAETDHLTKPLRTVLLTEPDSGVLLWGMPGVGKSYAMCAAAKHFISEGFTCQRVGYELLCLQLRDTFKPNSKQSEWGIVEPLVNTDKLFIEDIGTTKSIDASESDFSLRTLLVLVDLRMEYCRPTYITTNKTIENLASSFDKRIGDRLRTYTIVKLIGDSKR